VASLAVCDVTFDLARHEIQRTFYVLRDLRVVDMVLGLPSSDDEHASLQFGTTRVFTLMDGTIMEIQIEERRLECFLMSLARFRNSCTRRAATRRRNAEIYVIDILPTPE
jgi:hypothetical protein